MAGPSGSTPTLHLPYPVGTDTVDVPRDLTALATKLDTTIVVPIPPAALTGLPVLDVGQTGQIRAGRQLAAADFTSLGLSAPAGLWNLSDLTDASGNGRALTNKGTVPFGPGINGVASTAAVFSGSTAQALYISDAGATDPFRVRTGSWGCWFRTAKRGTQQELVTKLAGAQVSYNLDISVNNLLALYVSVDGSTTPTFNGVSDVCDDRWHFGVGAFDGTTARLYVDGVLEATLAVSGAIFGSAAPLNIGARGADNATVATSPNYGRVDEAFVTPDVLTDDQVRALYCARIAHGYPATPTRVTLNVHRRRRGAALTVPDFPVQPLRLHNFTAGALTDAGSNNQTLTNNNPTLILPVAGADGTVGSAFSFTGAHTGLSATDAGLPNLLLTRSYGCWLKTTGPSNVHVAAWGTAGGAADARLTVGSATAGAVEARNGADLIIGPYIADGQWHFVVVVEDNTAGDGVKRKLYLDGRLVGGSTVLNAITLGGAGHLRVGAYVDGTSPFTGQIDGVFVTDQALTPAQIAALYQKAGQDLGVSPKNTGDHVEAMDATNVLATFDTLDPQSTVDLGVSA